MQHLLSIPIRLKCGLISHVHVEFEPNVVPTKRSIVFDHETNTVKVEFYLECASHEHPVNSQE